MMEKMIEMKVINLQRSDFKDSEKVQNLCDRFILEILPNFITTTQSGTQSFV